MQNFQKEREQIWRVHDKYEKVSSEKAWHRGRNSFNKKKSKTVEDEESNSQSEQRKPRQEGERDADIDKVLTKMFCFNFLAFLLVENKYFIRFCQALNPNYRLPSRMHLSFTLVLAMYKDIHKKVETLMEDATDVITTDGWTSNKTENYEALTGHYISSDFIMTSATLGN